MGEDAQIIPFSTEITGNIPEDWERKELQAHMEAGNEKELLRIGRKMLALLEKKEASVEHFVRFAQSFSQQLLKSFSPAERDRLLETIQDEKPYDCYTLEAFDRYLVQLVAAACILYDHKKDQTDPICDFVLTYIHNHYGDDISLDIISDHLKITSSYLSTYFKEKMGMNFSDYVQTYRMKKAAELLETSELKVHEVAQRVGYLSVNSFIRNFKKFTGYPPGEYRKRN
ncbi:HTH-type transcriptional regulator YesS [compost metagenome]